MARSMSLFWALVAMSLLGCGGPERRYEDPNKTETVTIGFGRTDIQKIVKKSFDDFQSKWTPETDRPFICIGKVINATDEHVDTKMVTDQLRTALMESGKFRFTTDKENLKENLEDVEMQQESGLYKQNERTAAKGNWNPPEYTMRGRFGSIRKKNNDVEDVYYAFTLYLDGINDATTVFSTTVEISKVKERSGAGW